MRRSNKRVAIPVALATVALLSSCGAPNGGTPNDGTPPVPPQIAPIAPGTCVQVRFDGPQAGTVTADTVLVRERADVDARVIGRLNRGDEFSWLGTVQCFGRSYLRLQARLRDPLGGGAPSDTATQGYVEMQGSTTSG